MKLTLLLSSAILIGIWLKPHTSPIFVTQAPRVITEASTPIPTPTPKRSEVIAYIAKTFEPEGVQVMVKAVECFYSESGLRWNAENVNKNGTHDSNVAQINSIHIKRFGSNIETDFKANIDAAYQIYKERGFSAWYAPGCRN